MADIEKKERINQLFDIYESLFTEHQINVFQSYYQDDLSLKEIAEDFNISRNAVHDLLKRVEVMLEDYEAKLHLLDKINEIENLLENQDEIKEKIMKVLNR
jgi:predicted DNA-binding protein YlxM (UPF0122 family)